MQSPLQTLPRALLQSLGRAGLSDDLRKAISHRNVPTTPSPQHSLEMPHTVAMDDGLDLVLQDANTGAGDVDRRWGLQGFTLRAGEWRHAWPDGLDPMSATAQDIVRLFAPDPESCMVTPAMVCFTTPALQEGQQWSVLCLFDASSHRLQSFSLVRVGDWLPQEAARAG